MAKKKQKALLPEELEALHAVLNAKRENERKIINATTGIRNLKKMIEDAYNGIEGNDLALSKLSDNWQAKYGDVNINSSTGEFIEKETTE